MLLGLLAPVGLTLDREYFRVMDQAIDHGHHTTGVRKHLRPLRERLVGRNQGTPLLVAAVDQLEEQIGMTIRVGKVADLIDYEQIRRRIGERQLSCPVDDNYLGR